MLKIKKNDGKQRKSSKSIRPQEDKRSKEYFVQKCRQEELLAEAVIIEGRPYFAVDQLLKFFRNTTE
jgi:hypothetical protein